MNLGKKAVAPAIILVGALILVTVGLVLNNNIAKPLPVDELPTTKNNAQLAIDRAVSTAVQKFALFGFSNEEDGTDVWYCNAPFPPDIEEIQRSLHYYIDREIRDYLDGLKANTNLRVNGPGEVQTNIDELTSVEELTALDHIEVTLKDLTIGIENEDRIVDQEVQNTFVIEFNWQIYKTLREWMVDDAGDLSRELYDVMTEDTCAFRHCCCDPGEASVTEEDLEEARLNTPELEEALQNTIDNLNARFTSSAVRCTYSIEPGSGVRNDFTYISIDDVGCQPTCADEAQTDEFGNVIIPKTDFGYGQTEAEGGPPEYLNDYYKGVNANGAPPMETEPGDTRPHPGTYNSGCPYDPSVRPDISVGVQRTQLPTSAQFSVYPPLRPFNKIWENVYEDRLAEGSTYPTQELAGVTRKAAMLYSITCKDPTLSMETPTGFDDFSARILMRMDVQATCPPPEPIDIANSECGGGGDDGPSLSGPICTPFHCVEKYGGTEECWTCIPSGGEGPMDCEPSFEDPCGVCGICRADASCDEGNPAALGAICQKIAASPVCPSHCQDDGTGRVACLPEPSPVRCRTDNTCITYCDEEGKCAEIGDRLGIACEKRGAAGTCVQHSQGYLMCEVETENPGQISPPSWGRG